MTNKRVRKKRAKEKGASIGGHTNPQIDCTPIEDKKQYQSQTKKILEYLERHGSITQAEAAEEFGCYRLSARIKDLRDKGYWITTVPEQNKGRGTHARYFLK